MLRAKAEDWRAEGTQPQSGSQASGSGHRNRTMSVKGMSPACLTQLPIHLLCINAPYCNPKESGKCSAQVVNEKSVGSDSEAGLIHSTS